MGGGGGMNHSDGGDESPLIPSLNVRDDVNVNCLAREATHKSIVAMPLLL